MRRPHEVLMIKDSLVLLVFVILFPPAATQASETRQASDKIVLGWLHAIRVGVLAHDVDNLWSRTRKESGVDLNTEIIFSHPNFSLLESTRTQYLPKIITPTRIYTARVYVWNCRVFFYCPFGRLGLTQTALLAQFFCHLDFLNEPDFSNG